MYQGWTDDEAQMNPRQRAKRPCGAEVKRRRMAREAAAHAENNSFLENYFSNSDVSRYSLNNDNLESESPTNYANLVGGSSQIKRNQDFRSPPKPFHFASHESYKNSKAHMQKIGALHKRNQGGYNNKEPRFNPGTEYHEIHNGFKNHKPSRLDSGSMHIQYLSAETSRPVNYGVGQIQKKKTNPGPMNYGNSSRGRKRKADGSRLESVNYGNQHSRRSPVSPRFSSASRNYGNNSQLVSPVRTKHIDHGGHRDERGHVEPIRGQKRIAPKSRSGPASNQFKQRGQRLPATKVRQGAIQKPEPPKGKPNSKLVGKKKLPPVKRSAAQVTTKVLPKSVPPLMGKAIKRYRKVAILDHSKVGKLNQEQADLLMKNLWQQLEQTLLTTPENPPRFNAMTFAGGFLRVTCATDDSLSWLRKTVKELQPWPEAKLYLVQSNSLAHLTKVSFWIPTVKERGDWNKDASIKLLNCQNPELHVAAWCLFEYEKKVKPPGELFVFGINARDMGKLRTLNFKISYGFQFLIGRVIKDGMQKNVFEIVWPDVGPKKEGEGVVGVAPAVSTVVKSSSKNNLVGVVPVVVEKLVAVVADDVPPVVIEEVVPVVAENITPVVAEEVFLVVAEVAAQVATQEATPVVAKEVTPVVVDENTTIVAKEITPVGTVENTTVVAKKITPVVAEEDTTVVAKEISPVVANKTTPVVTVEDTAVVAKEITPVVAEEDTMVVSKEITPVVAKEVAPAVMTEIIGNEDASSVIPEVVSKEVSLTVTQEVVSNEVSLTVTQEVVSNEVSLTVTQDMVEGKPSAVQENIVQKAALEVVKEVAFTAMQKVDSSTKTEREVKETEVVLAELATPIEDPKATNGEA